MSYAYVLKDEANAEFIEAYVWYEVQREGLGNEFRAELFNKLNLICDSPLHYKKSHKNFHEALVERFPFLIVYTIDIQLNEIIIFAIFHTSRNPKKKFKR